MTRRHVSDTDTRWVMACDVPRCRTWSETFTTQPPLEEFRDRGWFVAKRYGDICPACLSAGVPIGTDMFTFTGSNGKDLRR